MDTWVTALLSAIIGGLITSSFTIWINHRLSQKRDKENREENERIQRRAEVRQYGTLEDQRKDIEQENEQKERLQAVKSYYVAFTDAFRRGEQGLDRLIKLEIATKVFRLEATSIDSHMHDQVSKILQVIIEYDKQLQTSISSYGHRASKMMQLIGPHQEPIFIALTIWGLHGKSRKFGQLMDRILAEAGQF